MAPTVLGLQPSGDHGSTPVSSPSSLDNHRQYRSLLNAIQRQWASNKVSSWGEGRDAPPSVRVSDQLPPLESPPLSELLVHAGAGPDDPLHGIRSLSSNGEREWQAFFGCSNSGDHKKRAMRAEDKDIVLGWSTGCKTTGAQSRRNAYLHGVEHLCKRLETNIRVLSDGTSKLIGGFNHAWLTGKPAASFWTAHCSLPAVSSLVVQVPRIDGGAGERQGESTSGKHAT